MSEATRLNGSLITGSDAGDVLVSGLLTSGLCLAELRYILVNRCPVELPQDSMPGFSFARCPAKGISCPISIMIF